MESGKRHDTTDTNDFCPSQLITDLLLICYGEATEKLQTGVMDFGLYSNFGDRCFVAAMHAFQLVLCKRTSAVNILSGFQRLTYFGVEIAAHCDYLFRLRLSKLS